MTSKLPILSSLLAGMLHANAQLLVHEPFDYAPVNDPVAGRLESKAGGIGFGGPWIDSSGDNLGFAFVYDGRGNPEPLYGGTFGGGQPDWDGIVNNLPTRGGYAGLSDWSNQGSANEDKWNAHRALARNAGELAGENGILWLSAVWHWPGSGFQNRPGIALTNGSHFGTGRSESLTTNGFGIGVGNGNVGGWPSVVLNATVWSNGSEVVQTGAGSMSASGDHVIVLKFEFGAIDKVSAWSFTENHPLSEEVFHTNAATAGFAIDEFALNTLAVAAHRRETAVDEFRIGKTFADVTSEVLEPDGPFAITEIVRDPVTGGITLTWRSQPGEVYGLQWSSNLQTFYPGISQAIPAQATGKLTTFGPFPSPAPNAERLFLRVGPPDTTPPALVGLGGGGDRMVVTFSEPMLPGSATDPAHYLLETTGGGIIEILAAAIGDAPETVVLTLASPLADGASYTLTVNGVTDPAGLPIAAGSGIGFTAWSSPLITEFMASSGSNIYGTAVLTDEAGDSSDWIEIHNPTADPVSLAGWHLTDNADSLEKWPLPGIVLNPGSYLVLFASGKDRRDPGSELHTNFSLAADGEYLALV
ncbi:MAG: lamin tail domain-containing protein, partial [Akkermansiaceae bacterium]|nr:lamin tail domain-containing protein [Akkermansiaceae bacterium]